MKSLLALGCLLFIGCAPSFGHRMDSQVGVMTVQDANARFGAPISESKEADGSTTAVWAPKRYASSQPRYAAPRGLTYGGSATGAHALTQDTNKAAAQHDRLVLSFDRRGVLQQWNYQHD